MADEKNLILNANQDLGEIVIAPEVIEIIIGNWRKYPTLLSLTA